MPRRARLSAALCRIECVAAPCHRWEQAGSRTQLPSLVLAVGTLLLLLIGTALLADIPSPAIGAIVAVAILPLLGIREFIALWKLDRFEFTDRRRVLPRDPVHRVDPRHPGRLRAGAQ